MRVRTSAILASTTVVMVVFGPLAFALEQAKVDVNARRKDTAAAELTRAKLLKARVTGEFTDIRISDILKEFAAQVDMKLDQPVMWSYGMGFPFSKKITLAVKDQPLEVALDHVLTKTDGGLGYVIVSKDGDKHDGWVLLTTTGERGRVPPPATPEEEKEAATQLANAKKLLDAKKDASAMVFLKLVVKKYPTSAAAKEAKELLAKIEN